MLNKEKHQLIMGYILKEIYTDISLAPLLGLKGGTAAYLFYNLPRFSVDLDFDFLAPDKNNSQSIQKIFHILKTILNEYGTIKDSHIKRSTIFIFLSYGDEDHNIKIEISTRQPEFLSKNYYDLREHLGISMLVAKPDYLFAGKLVAFTGRQKTAMRDIYDIYYFAKNQWDINKDVIRHFTGKTIKEHLPKCIAVIEKIKDNEILSGIGELLDKKQKVWVKQHLRSEAVFLLKNYLAALK